MKPTSFITAAACAFALCACEDETANKTPQEIYDAAVEAEQAGRDNAAFDLYMKSAEQGYAVAQYAIGAFYFQGDHVPKDLSKALAWFTKAAEQGFAPAQFSVGMRHLYGEGTPEDAAKAVEWLTKAAEQGNHHAQFNLGMCYRFGKGVEKDAEKGREWIQKAAEQGNPDARKTLERL